MPKPTVPPTPPTPAPEEWNPEKPLEDEKDEQEAQRRAKAHARTEHLKASHMAKLKKEEPPAPDKDEFDPFA